MHATRQPRILEIGNYPPPRCGWSVRTELLVGELRRAGADCQVLDIGPSRRQRRAECIDVQHGPDFLRKLLYFGARRYRFHVHVNGDSPKGFVLALSALTVGTLFGRRPVLTFHAGASQRFFPRRGVLASALFRVLFGVPIAVVCNSAPVREAIRSYRIPPDKIHIIPAFSRQYVAGARTDVNPPKPVTEFMAKHAPVLVCYAAYRPEFMLDQLLRVLQGAMALHPRLGVVIIGHLQGHWRYVNQARRLGIEHRLHFGGDLAHDEFLATLRRADLYVRTHLRDGVSSSVLEALALGTPVLAAANESRPRGVVTYQGTDAEDLRQKLDTMLRAGTRRVSNQAEPQDTLGAEVALLLRPDGIRNGQHA